MSETQSLRVQLDYPLDQVKEPIIYHLVTDYNLVPNIRRANIDVHIGGMLVLQLEGTRENLDAGIAFLRRIGVTVTEVGIELSPDLPMSSFRFESPLLAVAKSAQGYEGWYSPLTANTWSVRVKLPADEMKGMVRAEVNGNRYRARIVNGALEMRGSGGSGTQLRWSLSRG